MANEAFDPYHKWLGIPPKDQPPHHYRLLGVDTFESDLDVIENAADQRQGHVRSFQMGPNKDDSQRLLNEISAAKLCLLSPDKKAAYDAELRKRLKPKPIAKAKPLETPTPVAATLANDPLAAPTTGIFDALPADNSPLISTKKPLAKKPNVPIIPIAIAVGGGVFALLVLIIWLNLPTKTEPRLVVNPSVPSIIPTPAPPLTQPQLPVDKTDASLLPKGLLKVDSKKKGSEANKLADEAKQTTTTNSPEIKTVSTPAPVAPPLHKVSYTRWSNGDPKSKEMAKQTESFVGITEVVGNFLGDGEWFSLRNELNENWALHCSAAMGIQVTAAEIASPWRSLFENKTEHIRWNRGSKPVKLIHKNDGFAILSGAAGCFRDDAQEVRVQFMEDGYFYLNGKTNFNSQGEALIFRYKKPGKLKIEVEEFMWSVGMASQKLLHRDAGVCFISGLGGGFHGSGERVACDLLADGHWHLVGNSGQPGTHCWVTTIKFSDPTTLALLRPASVLTNTKREPIPAGSRLDVARAKLGDQLTNASFEEKMELAKTTDRTLEERYVLLDAVRQLATEQGDCAWALTASDALTQVFEMDSANTTLETMQALRTKCKTVDAHRDLSVAAMRQIDAALNADQKAKIMPLAEIAYAAARKSDPVLLRRATLLVLDARRSQSTNETPTP